MHFGIITPPVPGHIHPFGALGRELIERGHRVTLFQMEDVRKRAEAESLEFIALGASDHPAGSLPESLAELGRREGLAALRFTIEAVRKTTEMLCRDAPEAVHQAGIGMLLVDQTEPAGALIAGRLGLPYITVCNALALHREAQVPPPFTPWDYQSGILMRGRNQLGYTISNWIMSPVRKVIAKYQRQWGLPVRPVEQLESPLAQISQQPPLFDFPRRHLPPNFYYTGPLRKPSAKSVSFPWEKLDGRPLVYASLGTLQNGKERIFRCFAEACSTLPVQLVLTHGGGLSDEITSTFPGNPVVVGYAPQLEVLSRASLTLTHAGLNTVLDSLSCGVPLVAVPITYEQPAIAARIRWTKTGSVMPLPKLTTERLRHVIQMVLENPSYREQARKLADSSRAAGGVKRAAEIILGN